MNQYEVLDESLSFINEQNATTLANTIIDKYSDKISKIVDDANKKFNLDDNNKIKIVNQVKELKKGEYVDKEDDNGYDENVVHIKFFKATIKDEKLNQKVYDYLIINILDKEIFKSDYDILYDINITSTPNGYFSCNAAIKK